jgi:hypothetical protein
MREKVPQDKVAFPDFAMFGEEAVTERVDPAVRAAAIRAANDQGRKELGELYGLVEIGQIATVDWLTKELDVRGRLDGMIDRCLKRFLFIRGLKSISSSTSTSATPSTPRKQLSAA